MKEEDDEDSRALDDDAVANVAKDPPSIAGQTMKSYAFRERPQNKSMLASRNADGERPLWKKPPIDTDRLLDMLASSRRDPFGTLPFSSDAWSNQLVSHCMRCLIVMFPRMPYSRGPIH